MTKMPSSQYMHLVDDLIEENRTKLEAVYTNNTIRLHNSVLKMKQQLNNTIKVSVDTLKDIASVIESAAEYVREIKPSQSGSIEDFVNEKQNIVEFGNDTIQHAFRPQYMAAEKLSRNVSRLLKIIELNTNYARTINLDFCLTEKLKPNRISCLQSIMKSYSRYLIRVKNALKSYNEFNDSTQRKIDNVTRSTVIRTFQKTLSSSRTVVKNIFESIEITPDMLASHTQKKISQHSNSIKSYISRTNERLMLGKNVYDNFNEEYGNYKTVFDNLQNLALFAVDIIVYSKNVTTSELQFVKERLSKQSSGRFNQFTDYYKGVKSGFDSIREQIYTVDEQLRQAKPVNVSCALAKSGIAELFDCLHEKILYYSQILNTTKNIYNNTEAIADNILEKSDIHNRKVYDDFSLDVYNLTLILIKDYDVSTDDIVSYQQTLVDGKYNDTITGVNKVDEKYSEEYLKEIQNKVAAMDQINEIIDKVIYSINTQDNDNQNMAKANDLLTEMNETVAEQHETGSNNIAIKVSNITEYSVEEEVNDVLRTMSEERLAEKCSIRNESVNVVKVAHVLQCVERETMNFDNSMAAVVNDYTTLTSELEEINALFLHDMQATLRNGIKNVLPLIDTKSKGKKRPAYNVLTCLNKVDLRKSKSTRLEADLNQCSSILPD